MSWRESFFIWPLFSIPNTWFLEEVSAVASICSTSRYEKHCPSLHTRPRSYRLRWAVVLS